jgi:hypothetical protein
MLAVGRDDLVLGAEPKAGEDDVAAVRRRGRQREVPLGHADCVRQLCPYPVAQLEGASEVVGPAAAVFEVRPVLRDHRLNGQAGERAVRARVQVGVALEDGELRAGFLDGHSIVTSTGA